MIHLHRIGKTLLVIAALSTPTLLPTSGEAADSSLGTALCAVLKTLTPEVKSYKPEGARAQLVMAVAEKFDYDAAKLKQVKAEIDKVTTASCPKDREAMLGIVKMKSLAEAVS